MTNVFLRLMYEIIDFEWIFKLRLLNWTLMKFTKISLRIGKQMLILLTSNDQIIMLIINELKIDL